MKYILLPITAFVWFLISALFIYIFYWGFIEIYKMHWLVLLIMQIIFILAVLYVKVFPMLLYMLIEKFLGNEALIRLVHRIAGILGILFGLFFVFKYASMVYDYETDSIESIFSILWNDSPWKVLYISLTIMPFMIPTLWSLVLGDELTDNN